ncbi:DUF6458 family protein [Angustibacter sp. Root456]|jgi:hypothetical protein|uniref:DUF6458 family protein n=1 Tax=Angustibacter sp. Root456 TaxID=1736539 RepID=UPI0006FFA091|nr:DUF6458 family protein [Angustibacter sp. Root456]KQX61967.1 hypothetical protein ASD06_15660 [Angustibacter sp. Root456]
MGIGASIFLIAVGLILALAVHFDISGLDINVIGWILVVVGIIGLIMTALVFAPRRRRVATRDADVVEERRVYDDREPL